ncbi:MAG: sensor histidine kinase, partial [Fervidobacterium pennivorans]
VPESEKEKIFTRFYRTQSAVKMSSGSGLGLSVVKHLASLAGYKITFESQYLIGTTVIIWLG